MATAAPEIAIAPERARAPAAPAATPPPATPVLLPWLRTQSINVTRHAAALRPFVRAEFGDGAAAPSEGHLQAVNALIHSLRSGLLTMAKGVSVAAAAASQAPAPERLTTVVIRKERAHRWVQGIERIWDFYLELFGQRQSKYAGWLLSCDRIAMDCYQVAYTGLGTAKSIPAPPPFSYMRTGFAPATFRRGIPLQRLGKQLNPFPLIQLPYHRLINPWTLGAVLHEVSHNLQSDLGLSKEIPRAIALRLLNAGAERAVAAVWTRWNREIFADMSALLLGGPGVVGSLMDVIGRGPETVYAFNPRGVHPTPYLRALLSIDLLRRIGFESEADHFRRAWTKLYPNPQSGTMPDELLESAPDMMPLVVDTICFRRFNTLGNRSLGEVMRFQPKEQRMIEEAAKRLAAGNDPGIVPERFLIGAARLALDRRLARPGVISENFYKELVRR